MNGVGSRRSGLSMMLLLAWMAALSLGGPAAAAPAMIGPWTVCDGAPAGQLSNCVRKPLQDIDPQGKMLWLTAEVRLRPGTDPGAVVISAYASSAAYWNGKLIGMNGRPSAHAALEQPGLRDAVFALPASEPGRHTVSFWLSSHKGIAQLRSPVTQIMIAPYDRAGSAVMRGYLPALVSAGGLLIMLLIFAFVSWREEQRASSRYLIGAALLAAGQLGAEASRAFLELPYPLAFVRIGLVLVLAIGFGFVLVAYLARRFELRNLWPVLLAQALFACVAVLIMPSFDQRTALVLTSALAISALIAVRAATRSSPGALAVAGMLGLGLLLSLASPYSFLNRDLYLWTAALFVLLFLQELRRSNGSSHVKGHDLAGGEAKVPRSARISIGTAPDRHFVLPSDIVRLAAADDYTEIFLIQGHAVLHGEPLQHLLDRLPSHFLRVHRSHAINLSHLRSFRKGRTSTVLLTDNSTAPVSRRSVPKLVAALQG
jgi:hypothetical protein